MNSVYMRDYLYAFRPALLEANKDIITKRDELLKTEPDEFHSEINKQFYDAMAERLATELANNFSTDPEEVAMTLERFNIEQWIRGTGLSGVRHSNVY